MPRYSRKTLGLVRDLLSEKSQDFSYKTSAIKDYWRTKLFDIGIHNDVIGAMSSHSFDWTKIIPAIEDRRLGRNNSYFDPPLNPLDQAEALNILVQFVLDSHSPDAGKGLELRASLVSDGFAVKGFNPSDQTQREPLETSRPAPFSPRGRDEEFCRAALAEARKSILEDDGKPMVGVAVAKDGNLLAVAHRGEIPKNHAEYVALELKLRDAVLAGASVYTTLEPCTKRNHPKIPCAERDVTGVFCTSGSEREFHFGGSWYADEEIQAGAGGDAAAAD